MSSAAARRSSPSTASPSDHRGTASCAQTATRPARYASSPKPPAPSRAGTEPGTATSGAPGSKPRPAKSSHDYGPGCGGGPTVVIVHGPRSATASLLTPSNGDPASGEGGPVGQGGDRPARLLPVRPRRPHRSEPESAAPAALQGVFSGSGRRAATGPPTPARSGRPGRRRPRSA